MPLEAKQAALLLALLLALVLLPALQHTTA
jgi:hypothetical protein